LKGLPYVPTYVSCKYEIKQFYGEKIGEKIVLTYGNKLKYAVKNLRKDTSIQRPENEEE